MAATRTGSARTLAGLTVPSQGSDNVLDPQGIGREGTLGWEARTFRAGWMSVITIENVEDIPARPGVRL